MQQTITLTQDIHAFLIPTAVPIVIPSGTNVHITQDFGGSVTVNVNGNLARIAEEDAHALGLAREKIEKPKDLTADGPVNIDEVWEQLKTCYDPEIPVNIVDLGLIYECTAANNKVHIKMTLTAPGCGMGPMIASEAEQKVYRVKNVLDVHVELVMDPPWTQDRMSDAAKLELGLL